LKLSHQLASLDENNVRFSADSGVIDRLGKELVARHETAVSELVKNADDADATKTTLHFFNVDNSGGTLIIDDDGAGLTRPHPAASVWGFNSSGMGSVERNSPFRTKSNTRLSVRGVNLFP
jgi:hypothetical protein